MEQELFYVWETTEAERQERPAYLYGDMQYENDIYRVGGKPALWSKDNPWVNPETSINENTRMRPATEEEITNGIVIGSDEHMTTPIDRDKIVWLNDAEEEINRETST
jgi:hypothetical protein